MIRPPTLPKSPPPLRPLIPDGLDPDGAWTTLARPMGDCWHIPERDASGKVNGTSVRRADGRKVMVPGSKHGLIYPPALPSELASGTVGTADNPIIIVEGATDTATAMDMEFPAIGVPFAGGGGELLAELFQGSTIHVVLIGEHDGGKEKVYKLADRLRVAGCIVTIIFPPDGIKDLRAWKIAGASRDDVLAAVEEARAEEAEKVTRATAYLESEAPAAVSGSNGHDTCFKVVRELIHNRGLDGGTALRLMREHYNPRCDPPWSDEELQHKLADAIKTKPRTRVAPSFQSVPLEEFPEPARTYIAAAATALGVDAAMVAVPVLVALAAAIGLSRSVELKSTWQELPILWAAVVAASGSTKSAALDAAFWPLRQAQTAAFEKHKAAMERYESDRRTYESACRGKGTWDGPAPTPPACERVITSDTTVEALALLLRDNPRGLTILRDELAAFLCGFDRYAKSGRGGEEQHYLEMFNAKSLTVDRKGGDDKTIYVPRAGVLIVGTIQPGILRKVLGPQQMQDGLASRILFVQPPTPPKQWTEATVHPELAGRYRALLDELRSLPMGTDESGRPAPIPVPLSPEAKALWIRFYDEHNAGMAGERDEAIRAAFAKLEGYAARLALVLTLARDTGAESIDAASMEGGITLARWFAHEARRIYARFVGAADTSTDPGLVQWIRHRGSTTTANDLAHNGPRAYRGNPEMAAAALDGLARSGAGRWETPPPSLQGGRPTKRFRLGDGPGTETPILGPATGGFGATAG